MVRSQVDPSYFREHLPPNATIHALESFLQPGFRPPVSATFLPQLITITALLVILLFLGVVTIWSRLSRQTFWILKLDQKPNGTVVTFNSTNSFLVFQISYILAFLAMIWTWTAAAKFGLSADNIYYGPALPFILLFTGGYVSLAGTYQSVSQVIALPTKSSRSETSLRDTFTLSPKVSNVSAFGTPIFVGLTILAGAMTNGKYYQMASHKFDQFKLLIANSPQDSLATAEQKEFAAQVFEAHSKSFYVLSIVFTLWTIYSCLFTCSFIITGTLIIQSLRRHLKLNNQNVNTINFPTFDAAVTTFYPSRVVPQGVEELNDKNNRPINSKAKKAVLHSAVKLILFLGLGIMVGAIGFSIITGEACGRLYELSLVSPASAQFTASRLLLAAAWLTVLAGGFTFFLITASAFAPILEGYHHNKTVKLVPTAISLLFSHVGKLCGLLSQDEDDEEEDSRKSSSMALSAVKVFRGTRDREPSIPPGVHVQEVETTEIHTTRSSGVNDSQLESGILEHDQPARVIRGRRSSEDLTGHWRSRIGNRDPSPSPSGPTERVRDSSISIKTTPSRFSDELR